MIKSGLDVSPELFNFLLPHTHTHTLLHNRNFPYGVTNLVTETTKDENPRTQTHTQG